jgi:hypothetical protein
VLNERFTVGMGLGFALVLVGSVLATAPRRERVPDTVPVPETVPVRHQYEG